MNHTHDRRAPGAARIPFDAMVEVGGALGPTFEAQAVNLSEQGMSLRTAYLPEVGQPVMCRFDAGEGTAVVAAGEVLWKDDMGDGGEFGIRFTNLDMSSTVALKRILGMVEDGRMVLDPGRKVRLHIEGLASPMRARIRGQDPSGVVAYSDLGFLQMGRPLELEDASSGVRRPALIDRVEVEIDEASLVPQLVVSLRYDDTAASEAAVASELDEPPMMHDDGRTDPMHGAPAYAEAAHDEAAYAASAHDEAAYAEAAHREAAYAESHGEAAYAESAHDEAAYGEAAHDEAAHEPPGADVAHAREDGEAAAVSEPPPATAREPEDRVSQLKESFARGAAAVKPAVLALMKRAKGTASQLASRARRRAQPELPARRTTAPPPGGGLHTSGRKIVRAAASAEPPVQNRRLPKVPLPKVSLPKVPLPKVPLPNLPFEITKKRAFAAGAIGIAALLVLLVAGKSEPVPAPELVSAPEPAEAVVEEIPTTVIAELPAAEDPPVAQPPDRFAAAVRSDARPSRPSPFTNGNVGARPTVIRVKMDGPIERILGASQPTGFTVVIPKRKTLEPTEALASSDPRVAAIESWNEETGAELNVTFKDGVPNYIVRARGDTLELLFARPNHRGARAPEAKAKPASNKKRETTTKKPASTTNKRTGAASKDGSKTTKKR